jgi:hypothetical protein
MLEIGYFSLKELQEIKGPMDLSIQCDLYFEPKTLRELKNAIEIASEIGKAVLLYTATVGIYLVL